MSTDTAATGEISLFAAWLAIIASIAVLILLALLHILSPEFQPSWRMVSEYANGKYSWVLSLMFLAWAVSSWALAFALRSHVHTTAAKIGLVLLVAAGVGEAMASVFDINHRLHGLAALIGIGSLPIAAMLISVSLGRSEAWSASRTSLLWAANLTWVSVVLMAISFAILATTFARSGADMTAGVPASLPPGVIGVVGWANRFLIVMYCAWVTTVAWHAIKIVRQ